MTMHSLRVEFAGISDSDASTMAQALLTHLKEGIAAEERGEAGALSLERASPRSLDAGSIVVLVLGTPAVIKAFELVGEFIRLKLGWSETARVRIKTEAGELLVEGSATSKLDINEAIEKMSARKPKSR